MVFQHVGRGVIDFHDVVCIERERIIANAGCERDAFPPRMSARPRMDK
jgi:hypothetical protein